MAKAKGSIKTGEKAVERENPIAPFKPRKYACSRWPFLGLGGGVQFHKGLLTADSQEVVDRVEKADGFGSAIIEIKHKPGKAPSVEEAAEMAALKELEKLGPRVHSGAISTSNMIG